MATLVTPTIIAKEALITLENNTVLAGLVHRDYSKEYQKIGSTVVIRKPASMTASAVSGGTARHMNTVTESSVTVILDTHLDVSFEVSTQELSLQVVDFSEQFIQPAMRAVASTVDELIANQFRDLAGHYVVSGTPAIGDLAELEAVQDVLKVPTMDRRLVMHPITKAGYVKLDALIHANKSADGGRALRTAEIGKVLGYETYMDQNIKTHSQPIADSTCALDGGGILAATACTVDALTSGGTILANDVFKVTGYDEWFSVALPATADGTTAVVYTDQAFGQAMADNSVVTFQKTHRANMAFHKNCFAFVTAPLQPPLSGINAAVLNYKGLSCRVVYDYDASIKTNVISIDMLCGVKTLDADLGARLVDKR